MWCWVKSKTRRTGLGEGVGHLLGRPPRKALSLDVLFLFVVEEKVQVG